MAHYTTIQQAEVNAQFEEDCTCNVRIQTKPNVKWLRIVYKGNAEFEYWLDGKTNRETSREFAMDVLNQEVTQRGWAG